MSKFEKGDPRINRAGRPKKGQTLTDLLEAKLDKEDFVQKVINLLNSHLDKGETPPDALIKYIFDRIDGKPTEKVEVDSDNYVEIVFKEDKGE